MRHLSTRFGHRIALALICILAVMPAQAFDPVTMIAKEIIKSTIKEFIHNRVMDGLKAQMGQCAFMLAQVGAGSGAVKYQAAQASLRRIDRLVDTGVNAMPGIPGAGPQIPDSDIAAMKASGAAMQRMTDPTGGAIPGMPNLPQMPNMPAMPAGGGSMVAMPAAMGAMPAGMPSMAALGMSPGAMAGMGGAAGSVSPEQMAMVQQMMTQMSQAPPMSPAEIQELGDRTVAMSEMFGDLLPAESRCSPEDTRTSLQIAASMPMGGGAMRIMLDSFRRMDASVAESRATFEQMSPTARQEFIDTALADYQAMGEEERRAYAAMIKGNFFGMPPEIQAPVQAAIAAGS
ncbi:MAG: hypothetical protein ACREUE_05275 [Panacagrimonas sp.]